MLYFANKFKVAYFFQPMFSTIEDIYVVSIDTDRGQKEKVRFIDTAGIVNTFLFVTFSLVFRSLAVRQRPHGTFYIEC